MGYVHLLGCLLCAITGATVQAIRKRIEQVVPVRDEVTQGSGFAFGLGFLPEFRGLAVKEGFYLALLKSYGAAEVQDQRLLGAGGLRAPQRAGEGLRGPGGHQLRVLGHRPPSPLLPAG